MLQKAIFQTRPREWAIAKEGVQPILKEVARLKKVYGEDYDAASDDLAGWFRASKATPAFGNRRFRYIDKHGAYKEDDPTAPGGRKFELRDPRNGNVIPLRPNRGWAFDQATFNELVADGRVTFVSPTSIMIRRYLHETDKVTPQSVMYQPTRSASERLSKLLENGGFDFPKDELVLQKFIEMATDKDSLILDSFAGSGTTAHAVVKQNAEDGGNRRFILVEMEENIARDITAERVRRVSQGYTNAKGETVPGLGGGFRFATLGKTLFDEGGAIRPDVKFRELAEFVYFHETGSPLPAGWKKSPLLGTVDGRAVYLLYNGILADKSVAGGNVLTPATLAALPGHTGGKVIYAAACRLGASRMSREGIRFKQTPYSLRVD